MKIIIFTYLFPNSQNETRGIFNLSRAKALTRAGNEVCIIAPVSLNPEVKYFWPRPRIFRQVKILFDLWKLPNQENIEGIKTYHPKWLNLSRKIFFKYHSFFLHLCAGKRINNIIEEFAPDLIIGTWINPFAVYAKYIKKKFNVTFFALAEGKDIYIYPLQYSGFGYIYNAINQYCDTMIAVSNGMKQHMFENTSLKKISVVINGYDSTKFYLSEMNSKRKDDKLKIIMVALFNPKKGHMILLKAIKLIKFPIHLLLVGDGPRMNECKAFVKENGLEKEVSFAGRIPHSQIPQYLRDYDLFCLPSKDEGLPAAPLEAMACGLPVVASDIQGNNEIVKDGFNGYLCEPGSIEDLAKKIVMASNIQWDNKKISDWVAVNFGWDIWAKEIMNLYHQHLAKSA